MRPAISAPALRLGAVDLTPLGRRAREVRRTQREPISWTQRDLILATQREPIFRGARDSTRTHFFWRA
jgi:hypothetical protein